MREPFEKCHLQRLALLDRQALHDRPYLRNRHVAIGGLLEARIHGDDYIFDVRFRTPTAQEVNRAMTCNHREPCPEAAAIGIERLRIPPKLEKYFLQNVFRLCGLTQDAQRY